MSVKRKVRKAVKRGKKVARKAAKSKTGKDIIKKEKLMLAEILEEAAKQIRKKARK